MVSNGFNHVPDVFCHALLKLNIVIKCTGNGFFAGPVALQMIDAERFKQMLGYLVEQDSFMARLAEMEKELSEAKQAVILNAPRHQKLKEMSEGIVSMFRVDPDLAGPLMAMVTTMLGAI